LLVLGIIASLLIGKRKQSAKDIAIAEKTVKESLDKIAATSEKVKRDVQNHPATGADSSAERLRRDWSED
jgi:hypothetical protein